MPNKYEQLLERAVKCQEDSNNISNSLLKVADRLEQNTKELNDKFILHQQGIEKLVGGVEDIRETLLRWLKWLAISLFIAIGGTTIAEFLIQNKLL